MGASAGESRPVLAGVVTPQFAGPRVFRISATRGVAGFAPGYFFVRIEQPFHDDYFPEVIALVLAGAVLPVPWPGRLDARVAHRGGPWRRCRVHADHLRSRAKNSRSF